MRLSEDVWPWLPLPGLLSIRLSLVPEDKQPALDAASGGLRVDRCLGAAPYWLTCIARAFRGPVSPRRRLLAGRRLDGQTRCLGRVEQAFVISHEGSQRGAGAQGRAEVDGIQAAHRHRRDRPG